MTITIFITGGSGYIGGAVLNTLAVEKHPEISYRALVRDEGFAAKLIQKYPNVTPVLGDLDNVGLLEEEASKADIVINTANNDHTASPPAILRGLSTPLPNDSTPPKNRYLIHTSGTSIINDTAFGNGINPHIYNDSNVAELVDGLPDSAWHRDVDKLVLFNDYATRTQNVHVAIICPPCIYGKGTGLGKIVSWQIPQMIKHFINRGKGFIVNEGEAVWGNVHILDLAELYATLLDKALNAPLTQEVDSDIWDRNGYYLAATGEHHWGDTMRLMAHALCQKGLLKTSEVDKLTPDEIRALGSRTGPLEWGCNSRGIAERGRQKLSWRPQRGTREQPVGEWMTGRAIGLGRRELDEEISYYEQGLVA